MAKGKKRDSQLLIKRRLKVVNLYQSDMANYENDKNDDLISTKLKFINSQNDKMSTTIGLSTISSTVRYSSSINEIYYKNNEIYSIFVSMFTAALFLVFIMWRWMRIKSDLRKALREQLQEQRTSETFPTSSSRIVTHLSTCCHTHLNENREHLEALINQLTIGSNRDSRHNQQILNAAKHCLNQLRQRSDQERDHLNNYFSFSNRYDRMLFQNGYDSCSNNSTQTTSPSSTTPCAFEVSFDSLVENVQNYRKNELPPSYESLITKSSSLPSYCHVNNIETKD
jgi:hypothetical protein